MHTLQFIYCILPNHIVYIGLKTYIVYIHPCPTFFNLYPCMRTAKNVNLRPRAIYCSPRQYILLEWAIYCPGAKYWLLNLVKFAHSTVVMYRVTILTVGWLPYWKVNAFLMHILYRQQGSKTIIYD